MGLHGRVLVRLMSSNLSESHADHYWGGQHRSRASSREANAMESWPRDGGGLSPCSGGKMTPGPSASHELSHRQATSPQSLSVLACEVGSEVAGPSTAACWCSAQCHAGFTPPKASHPCSPLPACADTENIRQSTVTVAD